MREIPAPRMAHADGKPRRAVRLAFFVVLMLFALYYAAPLVVMVLTSLKTFQEMHSASLLSLPREVSTEAWSHAWARACIGADCRGLAPYFWNSVAIVVPAVILSTVLGALNGYALTKWRFRGANLVFALILFGAFVPFQAILLPMAQTLGFLGLAGTRAGLVLVHVIYGLTFTTLFFRNYFVGVPDDLVKAATIDGAGFLRIFLSILLPPAVPVIAATVIWQFTQVWNDFLFGASFASGAAQPITVALNNLANTTAAVKQYNVDMAGALIAGLPTLFLYTFVGRYFIRGLGAEPVRSERWRP
jgi:glucose/mannose transport system permease protein